MMLQERDAVKAVLSPSFWCDCSSDDKHTYKSLVVLLFCCYASCSQCAATILPPPVHALPSHPPSSKIKMPTQGRDKSSLSSGCAEVSSTGDATGIGLGVGRQRRGGGVASGENHQLHAGTGHRAGKSVTRHAREYLFSPGDFSSGFFWLKVCLRLAFFFFKPHVNDISD